LERGRIERAQTETETETDKDTETETEGVRVRACAPGVQVLRAAMQGAGLQQAQKRRGARSGQTGGGLGGPAVCYGTWEMEGDVVACRATYRPTNHPAMRPVLISYRLRLWGTAATANNRCRLRWRQGRGGGRGTDLGWC
jgi:hypothetical protein